jgi:hypothetical protein
MEQEFQEAKKGNPKTTPSFRDNSMKAEDEKFEREMNEVLREQEYYQNVLDDLLVGKDLKI